ncbi:MAG: polyprenyl synthetase family protein [Bacteroidales bacterium]|nr:polyprenyl synthetase family protein [Bacteroidales bacterium]
MQDLENYFNTLFEGKEPDTLYAPIAYTMQQSGKRLRPQMVYHVVKMFGGDVSQAKYVAAAFEMLHNFTLIHDDIMDKAPIRRGLPTVYQKWNTNCAILSGDALAIMAFQQLLKLNMPERVILDIANVFATCTLEICEGQQYDMDFETQEEVTIEEYIRMIYLKTAVMFAGCLKSGAILSGADEESREALYQVGINLGIAFQLADDLLDVYADTEVFGKSVGGDIRDNKKTYLYLKAMQDATPEEKKALRQCYESSEMPFDERFQKVKDFYERLQTADKTRHAIHLYLEKSLDELDKVRVPSEKKAILREVISNLEQRSK